MYKLVPLKYCLEKLADFIPYEEHHLMKEIDKPNIYCADTHPYLCNKSSIASGLCRKKESDCNISIINNEPNKFPIFYKKKIV
jgi:hypothetical protein